MNKIFILFLLCLLLGSQYSFAQSEMEVVDFNSIKEILKKDGLLEEANKKKKIYKNKKNNQLKDKIKKSEIPDVNNIWTFLSEYWLVKNAPVVKWNFNSIDYGLESSFKYFLEKLGFFEVSFKILICDSPNIPHYSFPANRGENIIILSLPFIRTLNLSKLEISLILFTEFLHSRQNHFKKFVMTKDLNAVLGKRIDKVKFSKKNIDAVMKKYDEMIFVEGYNPQQRYNVTKRMKKFLKNDLKLYKLYLVMLQKIDDLSKSNILYKNYAQIYQSPEVQLKWLRPKK